MPPRAVTPDLPDDLDDLGGLEAHADVIGVRISALTGAVSAAHSHIAEARIESAAEATLTRVRFVDCRADEVDTRGLRATDLDLRGLEALAYTDPRGLSGATLAARQADVHAAGFAHALGIRVAQ